MPKASVPEDTSGSFDIQVDLNIRSNVILFGVPANASDVGTYQRYEIALSNQPKTFTIPMNYQSEPQQDNEQDFGGLQILKQDNITGSLAAGAVFEVKGIDEANSGIFIQVQASSGAVTPSVEGEAEVNVSDGIVSISGLPVGKYLITEISPPPNYDISPDGLTSQTAEVQTNETAAVYPQVIFRNNPYGGLKVTKIDAVTGQPVAGATLRIRNEIEGIDITRTTDGSGIIELEDLPQGNYSVTEVNAGADYELNPQTVVVAVRWGQISEAVFDNQPHTSLEVTKINDKTNQPAAGARFTLVHLESGKEWTLVTLGDGKANADNIPAGQYTIQETYVPEPLILNSTVYNIQIANDKVNTYTAVNDEKPIVTVEKYDEQTGQLLGGAEFRLERIDGAWQTEFMNTTGTMTFTLEPGTYRLTEIAAPWGYIISTEQKVFVVNGNDEITIKFDNRSRPSLEIVKIDEETSQPLAGARFRVKETEGITVGEYVTDSNGRIFIENLSEVIYTVEEITAPDGYLLENQHKDIKLEWGITKTLVFTNKARPKLEIIKIDAQTKQPLAGAKFKVWETESLTVSEYITDENGRILIENLSDVIYSVEEIAAPEGYVHDPQHKDILLEWGKTKTLIYENYKKPTLTLIKYDELTNEPLSGASFRLWCTEGETWSENQVTYADGKIVWTDLDPGVYSVEEIDEPYGYFRDPARKEILLEGGDNKQLEFFNRPRPVLIIYKRDLVTGEPLANVKFHVQRVEGETIGEFVTNTNGRIELSPQTGYLLEEAIYCVTEIQPPEQYLLDANHTKDILLKWYEPTELIFENVLKPTLIFIKTNGLTGRGIDNATYKVEFEGVNGGIINLGTYKTKCGLIVMPYVQPGWYMMTVRP